MSELKSKTTTLKLFNVLSKSDHLALAEVLPVNAPLRRAILMDVLLQGSLNYATKETFLRIMRLCSRLDAQKSQDVIELFVERARKDHPKDLNMQEMIEITRFCCSPNNRATVNMQLLADIVESNKVLL